MFVVVRHLRRSALDDSKNCGPWNIGEGNTSIRSICLAGIREKGNGSLAQSVENGLAWRTSVLAEFEQSELAEAGRSLSGRSYFSPWVHIYSVISTLSTNCDWTTCSRLLWMLVPPSWLSVALTSFSAAK